jgi:hypothetical protein
MAVIDRGIRFPLFAEDFPRLCEDGHGPFACDEDVFARALQAEHPDVTWPLYPGIVPETLAALDLVEFLHRHASWPVKGSYHQYFGHDHLTFDKARGQREIRAQINQVLARNRLVYELDDDGRIVRRAQGVVAAQLQKRLPPSRDADVDDLLERAATKFENPDPVMRAEALEQLWDAFERVKTVLDPNKQRGAEQLISAVASSAAEEESLEQEMRALTDLGNTFRIRHH